MASDTLTVVELHQQGTRLHREGRLAEAAEAYQRLLQLEPGRADVNDLLAVLELQQGRLPQAEAAAMRAVELDGSRAGYRANLGTILILSGKEDEAHKVWTAALALNPDNAALHQNLAKVEMKRGNMDAALAHLGRAIEQDPDLPAMNDYQRKGIVRLLAKQGDGSAVLSAMQANVAARPESPDAWADMGDAMMGSGDPDGAFQIFQHVLSLAPSHPRANLAIAERMRQDGFLTGALGRLDQVLFKAPNHPRALALRGRILIAQGRIHEGMQALAAAVNLDLTQMDVHDAVLFFIRNDETQTTATIHQAHAKWGRYAMSRVAQAPVRTHANIKDPKRRLRIGYIGPDFRTHATTFFLEPVLERHDHSAFEIFAYADVPYPDEVTERLKGHFDHWRSTLGMGDEQVADLIQTDGIDLLVDLAGHTTRNRLMALALKPAPVQLHWIGYVSTTGLPTIDYRISDEHLDPPGAEALSVEKIWRLPRTHVCYRPLPNAPDPGPLPARANGFITFGCLSNMEKISNSMVGAFSRILAEVPGSRLLLLGSSTADTQTRAGWIDRLEQAGIAPERVQFLQRADAIADYLAYYRQLDIALGPFPMVGLTTVCESFWMGVPMLCLDYWDVVKAGPSILINLGLEDWVAPDKDAYVQKAVAFAADLDALETLRGSLRARMEASPLRDEEGFTQELESAYRAMWTSYCEG